MKRRGRGLVATWIGLVLGCGIACLAEEPGSEGVSAGERLIDFVSEVRPIFEQACNRCHGAEKQKSGYRLDIRAIALEGGDSYAPNILPGNSADSNLIQFVAGDGDLVMPPEGERLSAAQVATLRAWVDQGAKWPDAVAGRVADKADWWSLRPLARPPVPATNDAISSALAHARPVPAAASRVHPIDAFVAQKLAERGLALSPEADRATLIRRVYFDLHGLPPTAEDVAKFVADPDPAAFEQLVDRLLASPRYGERWARHWMDAAHFAETHGHDQDRIREHAWPYRDYLIQAFNDDKPYGRFVAEQVAGDVLFPDDPQATVALGFLAAGPWDESSLRDILEDTLDRQIARYLDRDDMIANVMNNFCSATVQCARCHDHKFDPISQADYYALQAVFAGVERANRSIDFDPRLHRQRKELLAQSQQVERRDPRLIQALVSAEGRASLSSWEQTAGGRATLWHTLNADQLTAVAGSELTKQEDGSIFSGGPRPERDTYTISAPLPLAEITALRLEVMADPRLPQGGPGRQDNGNLHLSEIEIFAGGPAGQRLGIASATADFDQQDWGVAKANDGVETTAWGIYPRVGETHTALFTLNERLIGARGTPLTVVLKQQHGGGHLIGRLRLSITDAKPPIPLGVLPRDIVAIMQTPGDQRTEGQWVELALLQRREQISAALATLPKPALVYAAASHFEPDGGLKPPVGPRPVHLLHRGEILQPRELATPGSLGCLTALTSRFAVASEDESQRRAALAEWLIDSNNWLTWRSIANRVWHHHFGRGLVASLNDFGHMGTVPSHPELLDWLAVELRDGGQSLKQMHRLILTSATYRQSSQVGPSALAAVRQDADNLLLWRMNRSRLDAECARDAMLAVAGRLDLRMGGPSDRQFDLKPGIHVTPIVDYGQFDLDSDLARRRSVYRFLFRTLPDPFMEALDCPSGDQITAPRINSVTVQQALAMWNDAWVIRQCEHLAARLAGLADTPDAQAVAAVQAIYGRPPSATEARALADYASRHGLANLCRLLFNSNEFLFVD